MKIPIYPICNGLPMNLATLEAERLWESIRTNRKIDRIWIVSQHRQYQITFKVPLETIFLMGWKNSTFSLRYTKIHTYYKCFCNFIGQQGRFQSHILILIAITCCESHITIYKIATVLLHILTVSYMYHLEYLDIS